MKEVVLEGVPERIPDYLLPEAMKTTEHELWGRFVFSRLYGYVLVVLNENNEEGEHPLWLILRHPKLSRIEFSVAFNDRDEARNYMQSLTDWQLDGLIDHEISLQKRAG